MLLIRSGRNSAPAGASTFRSNPSSRTSSQGSRCATPVCPRSSPAGLLSSPVTGFIPLPSTGKPLILPKPPNQDGYHSPSPQNSPLTSPQLVPTLRAIPQKDAPAVLPQFPPSLTSTGAPLAQCLGSVIRVPARRYGPTSRSKESCKETGKDAASPEKTMPNGYMLYCNEKRSDVFR